MWELVSYDANSWITLVSNAFSSFSVTVFSQLSLFLWIPTMTNSLFMETAHVWNFSFSKGDMILPCKRRKYRKVIMTQLRLIYYQLALILGYSSSPASAFLRFPQSQKPCILKWRDLSTSPLGLIATLAVLCFLSVDSSWACVMWPQVET